jgi:broad specificity phosphatase PhoE
MQVKNRWHAIAGVALVGASVIAVTRVTAPLPDVYAPDIALTAGDEQITLDLVRSAEDARSEPVINPVIPGPPLTETGQQQAQALADMLAQQGDYAGIYAGQQIRMAETAAPLADQLDMSTQILPGLNGLDAGIYDGLPIVSPGGILFALTSAAWILGLEFVPVPGSSDLNGVAFEDRFNDAVHTIYDNTVSGDGPSSDVAVSADQAILTWTLMNVNNPDFATLIPLLVAAVHNGGNPENILPPTGIVELQGDPEDGWTLVSFNGQPFPQDPGLATELFVDVRDVITAPQTAAWHIYEALLGGDPDTITDAFQTGLHNVGEAIVQFPESVVNDIADAWS